MHKENGLLLCNAVFGEHIAKLAGFVVGKMEAKCPLKCKTLSEL
jgi:hypothetical protein